MKSKIESLIRDIQLKLISIEYKFKNGDIVGWEVLRSLEEGEKYEIAQGSITELIVKRENFLVFNVNWTKGSTLGPHKHDCKETIKIIQGVFYDAVTEKKFKTGDIFVIKPEQEHNIFAVEEGITIVYFEKANI